MTSQRFHELSDGASWSPLANGSGGKLLTHPNVEQPDMPWKVKYFWAGVTAVAAAAATIGGLIWPWVDKPARESQVVEIQRSVAELKARNDKSDERAGKVADAVSSMAQNMAVMSEAQKRTAETVATVGAQVNALSLALVRAPFQAQADPLPSEPRKNR